MRTSAVKRFGGFNTSTFCTEVRLEEGNSDSEAEAETSLDAAKFYSAFGW
jgi:hypothetical protein